MCDNKQIRQEIVTYLCGDDDLSEEFIELLKAGNLAEDDGKIIREKLTSQIDSHYNFDLLLEDFYRKQLKCGDDYPAEEMRKYRSDEKYLELLDKHFPQSVSEAIDIIIAMLDIEDIAKIRKMDKFDFELSQHFGLGLFMRNNFAINQGQSKTLYSDILERSGKTFFLSDDISVYLLEEIWEEIQRRDFNG